MLQEGPHIVDDTLRDSFVNDPKEVVRLVGLIAKTGVKEIEVSTFDTETVHAAADALDGQQSQLAIGISRDTMGKILSGEAKDMMLHGQDVGAIHNLQMPVTFTRMAGGRVEERDVDVWKKVAQKMQNWGINSENIRVFMDLQERDCSLNRLLKLVSAVQNEGYGVGVTANSLNQSTFAQTLVAVYNEVGAFALRIRALSMHQHDALPYALAGARVASSVNSSAILANGQSPYRPNLCRQLRELGIDAHLPEDATMDEIADALKQHTRLQGADILGQVDVLLKQEGVPVVREAVLV